MAQPPSISLTILRQGDVNLIDLAEAGTPIPRSEIRVDDAFLREVSAEVGSVVLPGYGRDDHEAVVRDLQRLGELMFSHLLPVAAQRREHFLDAQ